MPATVPAMVPTLRVSAEDVGDAEPELEVGVSVADGGLDVEVGESPLRHDESSEERTGEMSELPP